MRLNFDEWDTDPEKPRSSAEEWLWLFFFAGIGAVPFSIYQWKVDAAGFIPLLCGLSAMAGAFSLAIHSWFEELPITLAFVPGAIAGAGAYGLTSSLLDLGGQYPLEVLFLASAVGSLPGVAAYVIAMRRYYS